MYLGTRVNSEVDNGTASKHRFKCYVNSFFYQKVSDPLFYFHTLLLSPYYIFKLRKSIVSPPEIKRVERSKHAMSGPDFFKCI